MAHRRYCFMQGAGRARGSSQGKWVRFRIADERTRTSIAAMLRPLHLLMDIVPRSSVLYSCGRVFCPRKRVSNQTNPRCPKRGSYRPKPETLALLKTSGNSINGVGETTPRRPSPFFWHAPDEHPWGALQIVARENSRKCPGSAEAFQAAYTCPELIPVVDSKVRFR
jgi:hypothetical protein